MTDRLSFLRESVVCLAPPWGLESPNEITFNDITSKVSFVPNHSLWFVCTFFGLWNNFGQATLTLTNEVMENYLPVVGKTEMLFWAFELLRSFLYSFRTAESPVRCHSLSKFLWSAFGTHGVQREYNEFAAGLHPTPTSPVGNCERSFQTNGGKYRMGSTYRLPAFWLRWGNWPGRRPLPYRPTPTACSPSKGGARPGGMTSRSTSPP